MRHCEEQIIEDLQVRIDRTLCVGFGDCITAAPGVFVLDDEGIAVFRASVPEVARDVLLEACRACPVDALTIIDRDGHRIAP